MSAKHCTKHVTCHVILKTILRGKYHLLIDRILISPLNRWGNWGVVLAVQKKQGSIIYSPSLFLSLDLILIHPLGPCLNRTSLKKPFLLPPFKLGSSWNSALFLHSTTIYANLTINQGTLWLLMYCLSSTLHRPMGIGIRSTLFSKALE